MPVYNDQKKKADDIAVIKGKSKIVNQGYSLMKAIENAKLKDDDPSSLQEEILP